MRKVIVFYFILLKMFVLSPYSTTGSVMILPSPRVVVCQAGDRLEVMCNSTDSVLKWRLTLMGMTDPVEIAISSTTVAISRAMINSSRITVSRTSERGTVPLVSTLVISSVSKSLNGTLNITCMELGKTNSMSATTTVYITGNIQGSFHPKSPVVEIDETFGTENVSVSMQWTQEIHEGLLVSYHISVRPMVGIMISMISNTKANLSVAYNTLYNVSVVADICGQRNSTTHIGLNYVSSTTDPLLASCDQPSPPLGGYILVNNTSTIEGATVTYICPGNKEKTAICTGTGQWEPNSSNICGETTKTSGDNLSQDGEIAVAFSITVFTVASIFFIVGFLCGNIYQKKRKATADLETVSPPGQTQTPYYDDVVLQQYDEQNLELKENVAYAPIR